MEITLLLNWLAAQIGVEPAVLVLVGGMIVSFANLTSRLIPDDAIGMLGIMRKVCRVVGLYASNRVTGNVSANDILRGAVEHGIAPVTHADFIEESSPPMPEPTFLSGKMIRGKDGRFVSSTKSQD